MPQAVGAAFRHPCPAHRVVSACGNVVLLQSIGTVRCQLPLAQAFGATLGQLPLAQAFGATLGQLPFSQTISPTFGDLILLELPFSQAIGATFGDLILLETLRTIGSQLWFLGAVCTPSAALCTAVWAPDVPARPLRRPVRWPRANRGPKRGQDPTARRGCLIMFT